MSPENRMPPSAITGTPCEAAARAHSITAVIIGTPMPAIDARRADRAGADADLHGVHASIDQRFRRLGRGHIAGDEIDRGVLAADRGHHVEHALRVSVGRVDDDHVHVRCDKRGGPIQRIARDSHGGTDPQPPDSSFDALGILDLLLDVFDGDQALQFETPDRRRAVSRPCGDAKSAARLSAWSYYRHRDQVLSGHDRRDRPVDVGLEPQVPIGQNADELAFLRAFLR